MLDMETKLKISIQNALSKIGAEVEIKDIVIEHSKDKAHGDYATTVAMQMARVLRKSPRDIAQALVENLDKDGIEKVEIAGPGFINFFMKSESLTTIIKQIVEEDENYGTSKEKKPGKINVEFVSANPTGDLHLGHARGAALGDVICRLYKKAGYDVTREYYVNDAGNQINNLALSIQARYHQACGEVDFPFPEDGYHGKDLIELANYLKQEKGTSLLEVNDENFQLFKTIGTKLKLENIVKDLKDFRVEFDVFSSELAIRGAGKVDEVLEVLDKWIYSQDGATYLKTSDFTDDKDRVLIKSDGAYTYLLPDIAYHKDKLERGFTSLIDCLGADHHGYIDRLHAAVSMVGGDSNLIDVEILQMVRVIENGEEVKMSKRSGKAITLIDLINEVGTDALRYFYVEKSLSTHMDLDLGLMKQKSTDNPVYYAQYAYARICGIFEKWTQAGNEFTPATEFKVLDLNKIKELLLTLIKYPKVIEEAATKRLVHKLPQYINELASALHSFYNDEKVITDNHQEVIEKLTVMKAVQTVLKDALSLIGVSAPEKMEQK